MYEEIAEQIESASSRNDRMAMFHFQVLKHSLALKDTDPREFCRIVGVRESYATEFRKMLSLARLMKRQGTRLT